MTVVTPTGAASATPKAVGPRVAALTGTAPSYGSATAASTPMPEPHASIGRTVIFRNLDQPHRGDSAAIITGVGSLIDTTVSLIVFPRDESPVFIGNIPYEDMATDKAKRPRKSWFLAAKV